MGQSPGETRCELPGVPSQQSHTDALKHLISPVMMNDNICKVLSTREDHPSPGVQDFY